MTGFHFLDFVGKDAENAFKNLRNRYSRDKKKVQSAKVSGTDTQSVTDAKSETSDLYSFLAWLDPYVQPRQSATNLVQVEDVSDEANDVLDIGDNPNRSKTPDPSCESDSSESLFKSKVTGRVKRPRAKDDFIDSAELELIKSIGNRLAHTEKQKDKDEESLFGDLIASQLRKMPNQAERLIAKMEMNNIVYTHLLKSSSQEGQHIGYVDPRYCGSANSEYHDRQNTAAPQPQHPLRLTELGNAQNPQAFSPGYFFQQHRHETV